MRRPLTVFLFAQIMGILVGINGSGAVRLFLGVSAAGLCVFLFWRSAEREKKTAGRCTFLSGRVKGREKAVRLCAAAVCFFILGLSRAAIAAHDGPYACAARDVLSAGTGVEDAQAADLEQASTQAVRDGDIFKGEGTVMNVSVRETYGALYVRCGHETILVRVETNNEPYLYSLTGRQLSFSGEAVIPAGRRNPGCFDYARYLKSRDCRLIVDASAYRVSGGKIVLPADNYFSVKKGQFYEKLRENMDEEEASVIAALLFGDKGYMDQDAYGGFQKLGIAHILAVSGLHVSLLYAIVEKLLGGRHNLSADIISLLFLLFYCCLCNYSVSVLRASLMTSLRILAVPLKRRYDSLSAASFCCILFLAIRPYLIFHSGMQLSFLAAFSVGAVLPFVQNALLSVSDRLRSGLFDRLVVPAVSPIVIQLIMLPACLFCFMNFTPLSFAVNPVAVLAAEILLPFGLLYFLLCGAGGGLLAESGIGVFAGIAQGALAAVRGPAAGAAKVLLLISGAASDAGSGTGLLLGETSRAALPAGLVILFYAMLFFFFSETRVILLRRRMVRLVRLAALSAALSACIVPFALGLTESPLPWKYCTHPLTFLDVGQGDCIHIHMGGKDILIDGGGSAAYNIAEKTLKPYLLKNGITKLDAAVITHPDMDHSLGIVQLTQIFDVEKVLLPAVYEDSVILEEGGALGSVNAPCGFLSAGDEILLDTDAVITVLYPFYGQELSEDSNRNCLLLRLDAPEFSALFAADLCIDDEELLLRKANIKNLPADLLSADILKIGHHGSAGSTGAEFLETVRPSAAVISCGKNNRYGHPSQRVVDLLEDFGIIYTRTDICGAVYLKGRKDGCLILRNAAGDKTWHISTETDNQENIRQRPW